MKIAYDATLKRPGCVLLQAALGGTSSVVKLFPVESWLVEVTPDLRVYEVTPAQLEYLVELVSRD